MRRLAGAVMAVAMLHLSVTPGAAACVDHGAMATQHGGTSSGSGLQLSPVHGAHTGEGLAEQTPAAPCEAPAQPSCCGVLAGCATIALAASHVSPAAPALPDAAPAHATPASIPTSRRAAPEPPPPKQ